MNTSKTEKTYRLRTKTPVAEYIGDLTTRAGAELWVHYRTELHRNKPGWYFWCEKEEHTESESESESES